MDNKHHFKTEVPRSFCLKLRNAQPGLRSQISRVGHVGFAAKEEAVTGKLSD